VDTYAVYTNNIPNGAFRGFGGPQACFAYEQQMDAIADRLGMDRLELRRINYVHTGDTTATGQVIEMGTRHGAGTTFWFTRPHEVKVRLTALREQGQGSQCRTSPPAQRPGRRDT
jgi:CO/xanthine dehydrogenase Mo-binding subunit